MASSADHIKSQQWVEEMAGIEPSTEQLRGRGFSAELQHYRKLTLKPIFFSQHYHHHHHQQQQQQHQQQHQQQLQQQHHQWHEKLFSGS